MKKFLLSLPFLTLFFLSPQVYAGECSGETPADYYVQVTSAVNLRDAVCEGNVIGTLATGTVVHAIGDLDGWVQVEHNGKTGFVWGAFVKKTEAPSSTSTPPDSKEPLYDVGNHIYKEAIWDLYNRKIVSGNPDGSFQPDEKINRAAFTKIMMGAILTEPLSPDTPGCFKDIQKGLWYTPSICEAKKRGIIDGYEDGSFRAEQWINAAEASKIIVNTLKISQAEGNFKNWYEIYLQSLSDVKAIPPTIKIPDQLIARGEMAELISRLLNQDQTKASTSFNFGKILEAEKSDLALCISSANPFQGDYDKVKEKVLQLTNQEREARGLTQLKESEALNASSMIWALNGEFTHTRPQGQSLAEYEKNIGVESYVSFGENLGMASFSCTDGECTQEVKEAILKIHQLFMDEEKLPEGQRGHFENIVSPDFNQMGFGLLTQKDSILLVFQYAKDLTGNDLKLCENL